MAIVTKRPSSGELCKPRWGTERTDRPTHGGKAALIAEALGIELMPWQRHVLDVALEFDPDTGRLVYRDVGLSVPRQSGKSTLTLILMAARCLGPFGSEQQVLYTAQDLLSAREKWEEDHVRKFDQSPVFQRDADYRVRLSNGSEKISFNNGAVWRISSTTDTAGHGKTLDLAVIDEAFSHTDFRVDQSFDAPMITRSEPQLWCVSTAGTDRSVYLNAKRRAGREAVQRGDSAGYAWFEWSAPEGSDLLDEDVWWDCMPALGHTISIEAVRSAIRKMVDSGNEDGARRAYLNLTTEAGGTSSLLSPEVWAQGTDPDSFIEGRAMIGVAVTPDRSEASLAIAGVRPDGGVHVDHVKTAAGTGWVAGDVVELRSVWPSIEGVARDGGGPASSLDLGEGVTELSVRDFGQACAGLVDGVVDSAVKHRGQPEFAEAVARATNRPLGDLWLWRRGDGDASVVALEAATVALGGLKKAEEPGAVPESAVSKRGGLFSF